MMDMIKIPYTAEDITKYLKVLFPDDGLDIDNWVNSRFEQFKQLGKKLPQTIKITSLRNGWVSLYKSRGDLELDLIEDGCLRTRKDYSEIMSIEKKKRLLVKPNKKIKEYYDYNECKNYLENKYNYSERDFKNKRDFWSGFILKNFEIHNGCYITFSKEHLEDCGLTEEENWIAKIYKHYLDVCLVVITCCRLSYNAAKFKF